MNSKYNILYQLDCKSDFLEENAEIKRVIEDLIIFHHNINKSDCFFSIQQSKEIFENNFQISNEELENKKFEEIKNNIEYYENLFKVSWNIYENNNKKIDFLLSSFLLINTIYNVSYNYKNKLYEKTLELNKVIKTLLFEVILKDKEYFNENKNKYIEDVIPDLFHKYLFINQKINKVNNDFLIEFYQMIDSFLDKNNNYYYIYFFKILSFINKEDKNIEINKFNNLFEKILSYLEKELFYIGSNDSILLEHYCNKNKDNNSTLQLEKEFTKLYNYLFEKYNETSELLYLDKITKILDKLKYKKLDSVEKIEGPISNLTRNKKLEIRDNGNLYKYKVTINLLEIKGFEDFKNLKEIDCFLKNNLFNKEKNVCKESPLLNFTKIKYVNNVGNETLINKEILLFNEKLKKIIVLIYNIINEDDIECFYKRKILDFKYIKDENKLIIEHGINKYLERDYISSMHILIPQFESFLRNILTSLDVKTNIKKGDDTQEQTFNAFLDNKFIFNYFSEEFINFTKIVMTDNKYLNLRNDIAHGIIDINCLTEPYNKLIIFLYIYTIIQIKEKNL